MKAAKISVIVPIYNVEKEINRCVDSIIGQTLKDIEIILVNDGSPDKCLAICEEYAKNDDRVKTIHKENGGLSDARNCGLLEAVGEFILFVDADDYIEKEACEKLYGITDDNLDIAVGEAVRINGQDKFVLSHPEVPKESALSGNDFLKIQLKSEKISVSACLSLYSRMFLLENNLFFKTGILYEDAQWTPRVFLKAKRVKCIDFIFYNYIIRENSITQSESNTRKAKDILRTCYELEALYEKIDDLQLKKLLNNYLMRLFFFAIETGDLYSGKQRHLYSKRFVIGKPLGVKSKIKAYLFLVNKKAYKYIYNHYTTIRYDR